MDFQRFLNGDADALVAFGGTYCPRLWRYARTGVYRQTSAEPEPQITIARRLSSADAIEALVTSVLASACAPEQRAAVTNAQMLERSVLERFYEGFLEVTETVSSHDAADCEGLINMDAAFENLQEAEPHRPLLTVEEQNAETQRHEAALAVVDSMDAQTQSLHRLRYREGQDMAQIAAHFDCGVTAVKQRDFRLRRRVRRGLKGLGGFGPATIDCALDPQRGETLVLGRIIESLPRRALKDEPEPFARRAAWAFAAAAIAGLAFAALLLLPES